eukprot:scaffold73638_cov27-Tisochrysis_lutea.AAC.2
MSGLGLFPAPVASHAGPETPCKRQHTTQETHCNSSASQDERERSLHSRVPPCTLPHGHGGHTEVCTRRWRNRGGPGGPREVTEPRQGGIRSPPTRPSHTHHQAVEALLQLGVGLLGAVLEGGLLFLLARARCPGHLFGESLTKIANRGICRTDLTLELKMEAKQ